ncbi:MAG: hypothetical protein R3B60_03955 [Candidatus Paceibacterota bacterium]
MNLYNLKSKKITLGSLILIGLVVIFIAILLDVDETGDQNDLKDNNNQPPLQIEEESQNIVGSDSLTDILARNENLECTITYTEPTDETVVQGTYFTSNGRSRGDFVLPDGIVSSIINNSEMVYMWSELEGQKYGIKASVADINMSKEQEGIGFKESIPSDEKVKYNCKKWTSIDGSIFEPPTDILFTDFGQIVNTGMEYGTIYEDPQAGIVLP